MTCQAILNEFAEKLLMKFKFSQEKVQESVAEVQGFSRLVEISGNLKIVSADPDDDMVVESAIAGNATHIVTGDKHLLHLASYQNIVIIKAAEFINLLS
ncbi:putative toxin-antitoxin system toxin component, PIN family [Nostoc sp. NMS7]|uniref:putative toxin-antitoxin system toxin component, PIN family n=1 Tax=Nostoc sp. NMS7 TaxID=2815391 RepID=UPI0025EEEEFD|nr:putative toxin-antitoxin system toxin component, PIN family [Nostoc sp. NMS7]